MRTLYNDMDIQISLEGVSFHALNIVFEHFERTIPSHIHGNGCYEIHYISTGHGKLKANDTYYLLKKTEAPTGIVECGFLSNWDECAKLQNEEYQAKLVWAIQMGVLKYLNSNKFT